MFLFLFFFFIFWKQFQEKSAEVDKEIQEFYKVVDEEEKLEEATPIQLMRKLSSPSSSQKSTPVV
jgi:hypothetical protein